MDQTFVQGFSNSPILGVVFGIKEAAELGPLNSLALSKFFFNVFCQFVEFIPVFDGVISL